MKIVLIILLVLVCFGCDNKKELKHEKQEFNCSLGKILVGPPGISSVSLMNIDNVSTQFKVDDELNSEANTRYYFINSAFDVVKSGNQFSIVYKSEKFSCDFAVSFQYRLVGIASDGDNVDFVFEMIFAEDCKRYVSISFNERERRFIKSVVEWDFVNGR